MKSFKSNINLVMIGAGALGFVLIIGLFFYEDIFGGFAFRELKADVIQFFKCNPDTYNNAIFTLDDKKQFFNNHPAYLPWLASMALQGAIWFILIFPATEIILRLKHELGSEFKLWKTILFLIVCLLIMTSLGHLTIFNYVTEPTSSFHNHLFKLMRYTDLARIVGIYFLSGIVLVGRKCTYQIAMNDYDITDYKRLRGYQDLLLNFSGLILSLGVVTSILYNRAANADHAPTNFFPLEFVVTFAAFNTLILIIFYLPNYFIMLDYGKRIVENKFPLEDQNKKIIHENFENQNMLSKNLKLDLTFTDSVKKTLLILSPLLTSGLLKFFDLFGN